MKEAIYHFPTDGVPVICEQIKSGHINETYLITTDCGAQYILQKINRYVFPNVKALMDNVTAINVFLAEREKGRMTMIRYLDTSDGRSFYEDENGGAWRIYRYVAHSLCLQRPETDEDLYECGRAFGHFQYALNAFPAEQLEETVANFHNTPDRYRQLREAVAADSAGRLDEVKPEIAYLLSREEKACRLQRMRLSGELPVRVTHNDTKINNVLLDEDTRKALCVIDLDTVMPGLSAFDFGDAIRTGASTAAEDERDLSKVALDLGLFRAFTRGFVQACPSLTERERVVLPLGAFTMTLECGMRFLTDYLMGDKYFAIHYAAHNRDRARAQLALAQDMEKQEEAMDRIVREETRPE